jgi:nucleotide-binding universal stress UspA family protein
MTREGDQEMEPNHGRIVVGVDGSPESLGGLRWAVQQAALTGSHIEAIFGWQEPQHYRLTSAGETENWREIAAPILGEAIRSLGAPETARITEKVARGHPAQILIVASARADLLVVGWRGQGGFVGMLLGSVSRYVIAHATCPVLVHRP